MAARREPDRSRNHAGDYPLARHVLTFLAILAIALAIWLVVRLKALVVLALISAVLAAGLAPAVLWFERLRLPGNRRLPRAAAILLVYVVGFVVVSGAFTLVMVPLVQQAIEFSKNVPDYLKATEIWLGQLHARYPQVPDYANVVEKAQSQLSMAGKYVTGSVGAVFGFFGGVASVFTALVLTFYILLSFEGIGKNCLDLVAEKDRDNARRVVGKMVEAVGGWLRGMVVLCAIMGTAVSLAMLALDVPYAYVIGIASAIGEPIPIAGPLLASLLGILIAAFGPTWKFIAVVAFFIVIAFVESNILTPKIMQKQAGLSPLTTIFALASGAALLGLVGAVLAVPVAAALRVAYFEVVAPAVGKAHAASESSD